MFFFFLGFTFKPQTTPVVSTSSLPVSTGLNAGTTAPAPSAGGFVFGAPKVEAQNTPSVSFAFGSGKNFVQLNLNF